MRKSIRALLDVVAALVARMVARKYVGGSGEQTPTSTSSSSTSSVWSSFLHLVARCIDHTGPLFMILYVIVAYLAINMAVMTSYVDQMEYAKIEALLKQNSPSIALLTEEHLRASSESMTEKELPDESETSAESAASDEDEDIVIVGKDGEILEKKTHTMPKAASMKVNENLSLHLPIMSFNIRHDSEEYNPSNHFTRRLPRIKKLFARIKPWIAGLQEGSNGQIVHILSELSVDYKSVIYRSRDGSVEDSGASIFYDSSMVELQENETVWMSETPHVPFSKSWSTGSPRMLNMARFRLKFGVIQTLLQQSNQRLAVSAAELAAFAKQLSKLDILVFNNHLDVWSEEARRAQSIFVGRRIAAWKRRFPQAFVVLTGDFNTAVGQRSYLHLTDEKYAQQHNYSTLKDAWIESPSKTSGVAHSFHGWQGTRLNNIVVRTLSAAAFTLFAMQMEMPRHIPNNWHEWKEALWNLFKVRPQFGVLESMPHFPYNRLHVDWILYQEPQLAAKCEDESASSTLGHHRQRASETVTSSNTAHCFRMQPVQASLLDVRSENFSSDHYPLVVVFQIKPQYAGSVD